jgi:hypothetical protein
MPTSEIQRRGADFVFGALGLLGIVLIAIAHCAFGFTPRTVTPYPLSMTIKSLVVLLILFDGLHAEERINPLLRMAGYGMCTYVFFGGVAAWL